MSNRTNIVDDDFPVLKGREPEPDFPILKKKEPSGNGFGTQYSPTKSLSPKETSDVLGYIKSTETPEQKIEKQRQLQDAVTQSHPITFSQPRRDEVKKQQVASMPEFIANSPDLENAIYRFSGIQNPDNISQVRKGEVLSNILNNKEFENYIESNPILHMAHGDRNLLQEYRNLKANLPLSHPTFAVKDVAQKIGNELQYSGTNLLMATPSNEELDSKVDDLVKQGKISEQEKTIYLKNKDVVNAWVRHEAPDVVHSFGRGLQQGAAGFESTMRDISNTLTGGALQKVGLIESDEDRAKRLEQEQGIAPVIEPKNFTQKAVKGASEFTGFSIPMILGTMLTRGAGMSEQASAMVPAGLQFEGINSDRSRELFPEDANKQKLYTLLGTTIDVGLGAMLPSAKIGNALASLKRDIADGVAKMTGDVATDNAIKEGLLSKVTNLVGGTLKSSANTASVATGMEILHNGLDAAFGQRDFNLEDEAKHAVDTWKTMFVSALPLGAAHATMQIQPKLRGRITAEIAENPEQSIDLIKEQADKTGESPQVTIQKIASVNDAAKSWESIQRDLPEKTDAQKEKFLVKDMEQKALDKQAAAAPIDVIKSDLQDKANEAYADKVRIYNDHDKAPEHETFEPPAEERKQLIDQAGQYAHEITNDVYRSVFKGNEEMILKEAAEQLNASPSEAKTARSIFGDHISDIALKLFPSAKVDVNLEIPKSDNIKTSDQFRTWNLGDWEGKPETKERRAEMKETAKEWDKPAGGNGETFGQFVGRVVPGYIDEYSKAKDNAALVTHSSDLKVIKTFEKLKDTPEFKDAGWQNLNEEQRKLFSDEFTKESTDNGDVETYEHNGKKIHVIRHGQTEDNANGNFRSPNTKLTEKGIKQGEEAGKIVRNKIGGPIPEVITSDLPRAIHTSNIILENIKGGENALQEQSPSGVLQHPSSGAGESRSIGGGMEPSQQGEETTGTRQEEKEVGGEPPSDEQVAVPSGEEEGNTFGVRHESLNKVAEKIGLKRPERGTFLSPEEQIKRGRALLNGGVDPQKIADDFKKDGKATADEISVARAHYENLTKEAQSAFDKYGKNSPEFEKAKNEMQKWQDEVIKPMGTSAGSSFSALQGETDLDTGSFIALRQAFVDKNGKEPTPAQEKTIQELSDKVKGLSKDVDELKAKLTEALDKAINPEKSDTIKQKAKKIATSVRSLKASRPDTFSAATPASLVWDGAVEITAKTIEAGGEIAQAIADGIAHIKESAWYQGLDKNKQDAAEKSFKDSVGDTIEDSPEVRVVKRLEKQLEDLRQGIVKQKGIAIEETPEIKDLREQVFEAKKNLGLIKPKNTPVAKAEVTEEQKRINRLEKQLEDLRQGIVKSKTEPFEDTKAIKELKDKIFDAKKELGLIPSKNTKSTPHELKITAAEKKIESLEKQKEDLENGIVKQKNVNNEEPSPAQKEKIKQLNEDIYDLKKNLGLLKSKEEKPLTDQEKVEQDEKNAQNIAEQFVNKKDNKFTPEEAKSIWEYAKDNYLNKGSDFDQMISGTAMDLGLKNDQVRDALTTPKGTKVITDAMYKKQNERNMAIQRAKDWAQDAKTNPLVKFLKSIPRFFFAAKVFGHGTVGMVTHSGINVYDPVEWKRYWPVFFKQFKFAYGKQADYERAMADLKNDSQFQFWKRNGLAVDPSERYDEYQFITKIFEKMGKVGRWLTSGDRGFNALKVYRLLRAKALWENTSKLEKSDPNTAKEIANLVNHSTGTVGLKVSDVANTAFFAPKLELARWNKLIADPAKAVKTFTNWNNASPAEKVAAKIVAARTGRILGTYLGALAVNQGLLALSGSNQKINYTNPMDSDWLKFKAGGRTIDLTGGMVSLLGFLTRMGHEAIPGAELKNKSIKDEMMNQSWNYLGGKLSPFASTVKDVATHHDFAGNTLPFYNDKPLHSYNKKLSFAEYIEKQQTPIPVAEYFTDLDKQMKDQEVPHATRMDMLQSILVAGLVGGTGVHIGEEPQKRPTPFTDMDKKDPVFKVFLDKGLELPNTSLNSEKVKDKNSHIEKKISDYPDEKQQEYQSVHKSYLRESLNEIVKRGYVYVNPYGDVATHRNEEGKRKAITDLSKEETAKVLHIAQTEATIKAKRKIFKQK